MSEEDSNREKVRSVSGHYVKGESRSSYTGSRRSLRSSFASLDKISDKLNHRIVDKMVKMIEDKKKEIIIIVIKGIKIGDRIGIEWVRFLKK